MLQHTEKNLEQAWERIQAGARNTDLMKVFNCTYIEAMNLFDAAFERFAGTKHVIIIHRPEAQYSAGHLNTLNKYEN